MRLLLYPLGSLLFSGILILMSAMSSYAERMVTDLSRHVIEISSEFSGTQLLIFGAIEREMLQASGLHDGDIETMDYDIIVVVQSAPHDMVVRRKELVGPIWVNKNSQTLKDVPGYYAVITTKPLNQMLPEEETRFLGIGMKQMKLEFDSNVSPEEEKTYRDGFIRIMKAKNLYSQQEGMVSILDDILFRAILYFPANMPVGDYQVDIHLVKDGEILLSEQTPLEVGKTGLERLIYMFAHEYAYYYGIMAIIMALFAGWLGGFLSRKMSG